MLKLLFGVFFSLMTLSITYRGNTVDLLPDFVGCALLALGMSGLRRAPAFERGVRIAWMAAAWCAVIWLFNLLGITMVKLELYLLCSMSVTGAAAYVTWTVCEGLVQLENQLGIPLNGEKMKIPWMIYVVCMVLTFWTTYIGDLDLQSLTMTGATLSALVCCVFMFVTWRGYAVYSKKRELPRG